jgi:hypothetical protein
MHGPMNVRQHVSSTKCQYTLLATLLDVILIIAARVRAAVAVVVVVIVAVAAIITEHNNH